MIYSPLEQFEISPIMIYLFGDPATTNASKIHVYAFTTGMLCLVTAVVALVVLLEFSTHSIKVVPRPWQVLAEKVARVPVDLSQGLPARQELRVLRSAHRL